MKLIGRIGIMVLVFSLNGCATVENQKASARLNNTLKDVQDKLLAVNQKFELAKAENLNLKKEIVLFRKYQDIDTPRFIKASEVLQKELCLDSKGDDVLVQITPRGLVISIVAEKIFLTGTDDLSDKGKIFLDKVAILIEELFPSSYLYVEGHTDNQSLVVFEWKSDWDFSFARALSVLKYFTEVKHLDPWRLSASGFGQYRPRVTNDTKEGRRLNRRIEIVISPQKFRHAQTISYF